MNPYLILSALIGGIFISCGIAWGGYEWGADSVKSKYEAQQLVQADKIIVRQQFIDREVPKIVTQVVTRTVTVEKVVDHVITKIEHDIPADCVLPDNYGVLLVAAARGLDPDAPGVADALSGAYGCREVLAATLKDLKAGYVNTFRLDGLQAYVRVITQAKVSP